MPVLKVIIIPSFVEKRPVPPQSIVAVLELLVATVKLKAVAVDSGNGGILPSSGTVENEQYIPLSRPLFLYVNAKRAQEHPALEVFVEYDLDKAPELVAEAGYIPLPEDAYHIAQVH